MDKSEETARINKLEISVHNMERNIRTMKRQISKDLDSIYWESYGLNLITNDEKLRGKLHHLIGTINDIDRSLR